MFPTLTLALALTLVLDLALVLFLVEEVAPRLVDLALAPVPIPTRTLVPPPAVPLVLALYQVLALVPALALELVLSPWRTFGGCWWRSWTVGVARRISYKDKAWRRGGRERRHREKEKACYALHSLIVRGGG